jgi:predicted Zn-dependent protease
MKIMQILKNTRAGVLGLCLSSLGLFISCNNDESLVDRLLFPPEDDVELGRNVVQQIESDPVEFPVLSKAEYPEAYAYLEAMTAEILQSDDVKYKDIFPYEVKIIHRDDVLNAFATPGGFMYVYTGLIKFLDNADDLAGVMGHEVAHASERHSIDQLKQQFGVQLLISIALGEGTAAQVAQVASSFLSLKFSRDDETEADDFSVLYLSDTDYACNGAASFFAKIEAEGGGSVPEFLSTHPSPDNRVQAINDQATEVGCDTTPIQETGTTYQDFKNSLPQ